MPPDPDPGPDTRQVPGVPPMRPWWRSALAWVRSHFVLTILGALLLWVLVEASTIPWLELGAMQSENPEETALMRQRREEATAEGKRLTIVQKWVPLKELPRHFLDAVVVAEDGTFYRHGGIEWYEVWESFRRNLKEGRVARGASSITQQLAKNLYLSTSQTPIRKLKELVITLLLEQELTKDRILEVYLNVIEWGPGVFGVGAAAEHYFDKPASQLTVDESVRLAAVIPSPLRQRPDRDNRYIRFHTRIIRERMLARGMWPTPKQGEPAESPAAPPIPDANDAVEDTIDAL